MRIPLYNTSVEISTWNQLADYAQLHPGKPLEECLDECLKIGLRNVDKAAVYMPMELFLDLVDCAYTLSKMRLVKSENVTQVTATNIKDLASKTYIWSLEYHPVFSAGDTPDTTFPPK